MRFADWYDVLGVSRNADLDAIQEAYVSARADKDDYTRMYFADIAHTKLTTPYSSFRHDDEVAARLWPQSWRESPHVNIFEVDWYEYEGHPPSPIDEDGFPALRAKMKRILRQAVRSGRVDAAEQRLMRSLVARDLCQSDGSLTEWGWVNGIAACPLAEQCELLGIPHSVLVARCGKPEAAAQEYFEQLGYSVTFSEGAVVHQLLFCLALGSIRAELPRFDCPYDWVDESRQLYGLLGWPWRITHQLRDVDAICEAVERWRACAVQTSTTELEANASEYHDLARQARATIGSTYSHLDMPHMTTHLVELRECIGDRVAALFDFAMTTGVGRGWPDLVVMDGKSVQFVEVKKGDKLLPSQVLLMPALVESVDISASVLRIKT